MPRVVCISDTHSQHDEVIVPDGDILLHAGDMAARGVPHEYKDFDEWLGDMPHKHKIIIAGNHDMYLEMITPDEAEAVFKNATYLQDSEVTVEGLTIWGAPWTPLFNDWYFMFPRGSQRLRERWSLIPKQLDILLTHGPPEGKLDFSDYFHMPQGCGLLRERVMDVQPRYHIFGHMHEEYGFAQGEHTVFVNCSTCDRDYFPHNPPIVLDIEPLGA
jgi:predicted phosphohydrolase